MRSCVQTLAAVQFLTLFTIKGVILVSLLVLYFHAGLTWMRLKMKALKSLAVVYNP